MRDLRNGWFILDKTRDQPELWVQSLQLDCWIVGLLDRWIVGSLDCWIVGLLDCWIVGSLDCWIGGLLDCWIVGLLDCWIVGSLDCWIVGLLDCWIGGLVDCWIVGLLDCWIVGLLDCWIVGLLDCVCQHVALRRAALSSAPRGAVRHGRALIRTFELCLPRHGAYARCVDWMGVWPCHNCYVELRATRHILLSLILPFLPNRRVVVMAGVGLEV